MAVVPAPSRPSAPPQPVRVLAAAAAALVLGGLTSPAQAVLPDWIASIANSVSGWTLVVVLVVALLRIRPLWAALAGPVCFVALTLGYQVVSTWRGHPDSEEFFLVMGVVAGPFVGVAAAWLRERGWRPGAAAALLGGIGLGEGVFGLTVVADTTSPVYWALVLGAAIALVAVVAVRRARGWQRLIGPVGAIVVAAAFLGAFAVAG